MADYKPEFMDISAYVEDVAFDYIPDPEGYRPIGLLRREPFTLTGVWEPTPTFARFWTLSLGFPRLPRKTKKACMKSIMHQPLGPRERRRAWRGFQHATLSPQEES